MGMSIEEKIEEDLKHCSLNGVKYSDYVKKHYIPKADYEARLKADMVAMLEELKEQLREMHEDFFETEHFDEAYGVSDSMDIIQEKINALSVNTCENTCDSHETKTET